MHCPSCQGTQIIKNAVMEPRQRATTIARSYKYRELAVRGLNKPRGN